MPPIEPRHLVAATLLAGASILPMSGASAQTMLKWAHVYETSEPYHTCAVAASEPLLAATEGRYGIEVFPASSLGKETDINEGLGLGTVDIIYTGQSFAGTSYGPIAIGGAPFMFRDFAHWDAYRKSDLFRGSFGRLCRSLGQPCQGVHLLRRAPCHLEQADPQARGHEGPEDPRSERAALHDVPRRGGANPTPIAFAEVYLALQQGTVDAPGEPAADHPGEEILRGAVRHQPHRRISPTRS